jgi:hypothetical protein
MQADRERRYATARELWRDVERIVCAGADLTSPAATPAREKIPFWIALAASVLLACGGVWWIASTNAPRAASVGGTPGARAEHWVDLLRPGAGGMLRLEGVEKPGPDGLVVTANGKAIVEGTDQPARADGALRVRARFELVAGSRLSVRARYNASGQTYALMVFNPTKVALQLWAGDGGAKTLRDFALSEPLKAGEDYELELRAVGSTLTARLNGETLGVVEDATLKRGTFMVALGDGRPVTVRALEYLDLSAAVRSAGAPASSAGWRDALAESPLKEVTAKSGRTPAGYLMPAGQHWSVTPSTSSPCASWTRKAARCAIASEWIARKA